MKRFITILCLLPTIASADLVHQFKSPAFSGKILFVPQQKTIQIILFRILLILHLKVTKQNKSLLA